MSFLPGHELLGGDNFGTVTAVNNPDKLGRLYP